MNFLFLHPTAKYQQEQSEPHPVVHNESSNNMNEGGEFLDDAIRTEDLPVFYSKESIVEGSPIHLL